MVWSLTDPWHTPRRTLPWTQANKPQGRSQLLRLHLGLPARPARKAETGMARRLCSPSVRSGVMNRKSASRDESPSHRRRPSFDTEFILLCLSCLGCCLVYSPTGPGQRVTSLTHPTGTLLGPGSLPPAGTTEWGLRLPSRWWDQHLKQVHAHFNFELKWAVQSREARSLAGGSA